MVKTIRKSILYHKTVNISDNYHANSGVPQSSNLCLLLFTLFINDLASRVGNSKCLLFRKLETVRDRDRPQNDINNILELNLISYFLLFKKCKILSLTWKKKVTIIFDYT